MGVFACRMPHNTHFFPTAPAQVILKILFGDKTGSTPSNFNNDTTVRRKKCRVGSRWLCKEDLIGIIIIIIIIINDTLARSLEPVVTECKEHTIHTQTQNRG